MTRFLNLARAAQLVGVPRSTLQRLIRDGEMQSFDGLLDAEELLRVFPEARLEDAGMLDTVNRIREESFGRRIRERALPSQEILAQRIFRQSEELSDLRRHLQQYHALVQAALARLDPAAPDARRDELHALLAEGLDAILASENPDHELEVATEMLNVVSAHVSVRPSGHEFIVEGKDTLLQAGLKAGLRLNYGCGSGSCGLCKARVVAGEVRQTAGADYPLSEAERNSGVVLTCVSTPVTDVVLETLEAQGPEDIPPQDLVATLRALKPLGADTLLLHLQTPRSNRLRFLAGQSVTVGTTTRHGDLSATYPIASCPCDDRNLHFHIVRDPADAFAARLFAGDARAGEPVNLRGPLGDFTLPADDAGAGRPLVFLACDTGFAPVKGLIEHALAVDSVDTFGLVWLATRPDGHYLANQCRMWAEAFDAFAYRPLAAADPVTGGRLAASTAAGSFAFLDGADVFIAGPAGFVAAAGAELASRGASGCRIISTVV